MTGNRTSISIPLRTLVSLFGLLGWMFVGCGIKGPPVPPHLPSIQEVTNLSYEAYGPVVNLYWSVSERPSGKSAKDASFGIYQSRTSLDAPVCEGCPQIYEKVTTIPFVDRPDNRYETSVQLSFGYRYTFKVRLETRNGTGPDCQPVQFDLISTADTGETMTP